MHVKTGNYLREILFVTNLAGNHVQFEKADEPGVKLIVTDIGKIAYEMDNTQRSVFIAELCAPNSSNLFLLNAAHKSKVNVYGARGWYVSMSPGMALFVCLF